jgi:hypothetical protein
LLIHFILDYLFKQDMERNKVFQLKMKLEFYRNYHDIDKNEILFELDLNSNLNFSDENENELIQNYLPINIKNLLELYIEPYYKVEILNYLIELCLGILAYNIRIQIIKLKVKII